MKRCNTNGSYRQHRSFNISFVNKCTIWGTFIHFNTFPVFFSLSIFSFHCKYTILHYIYTNQFQSLCIVTPCVCSQDLDFLIFFPLCWALNIRSHTWQAYWQESKNDLSFYKSLVRNTDHSSLCYRGEFDVCLPAITSS